MSQSAHSLHRGWQFFVKTQRNYSGPTSRSPTTSRTWPATRASAYQRTGKTLGYLPVGAKTRGCSGPLVRGSEAGRATTKEFTQINS